MPEDPKKPLSATGSKAPPETHRVGSVEAMSRSEGSIGLIAGAGDFPSAAVRALETGLGVGRKMIAIGFRGITDPALEHVAPEMHWLDFGEIGALARQLRSSRARDILLIGKFSKLGIFSGDAAVSFDVEAAKLLAAQPERSDDDLMALVARWLEGGGFTLLDQGAALASMLVSEEVLTRHQPTAHARADLAACWSAHDALGLEGDGQSVVVNEGVVVATESAAGTDSMIRKAGECGAVGATVVKAARTTQDRRFDLPAVGPETIRAMKAVGARALALEAGATLMLDRANCVAEANRSGITIWGFDVSRARL